MMVRYEAASRALWAEGVTRGVCWWRTLGWREATSCLFNGGVHVGGGEQGHVEEESAASPKKRCWAVGAQVEAGWYLVSGLCWQA